MERAHHTKKPSPRDYFIAVFVIVFIYWGFVRYDAPPPLPRASVMIGPATITVDLAETQTERTRGLSGRKTLSEGEGMLLVFATPDRWGIWMPKMRFPIDAVWIDADRHIVHIAENILPETYPKVFQPDLPALYILEVPAGTAGRHGWRAGDIATLPDVTGTP